MNIKISSPNELQNSNQNKTFEIFENTINSFLDKKTVIKLIREYCDSLPYADIAEYLSMFENKDNILFVIRCLTSNKAAEVFSYLPLEQQKLIINNFSKQENSKILDQLYSDDLVDLLEELPIDIVVKLLSYTKKEKRSNINKLLKYDDCAGELISTNFLYFYSNEVIEDVIEKIKENKISVENTNYYYIVDQNKKFIGYFSLKNIFFHKNKKNKLIKIARKRNLISIKDKATKDELIQIFKKYDLSELPVENASNQLVGIITFDDIMDLAEEEATKDIEQISGIVYSDEEGYFKTSFWKLFKKRIVWLCVLMVSLTIGQILYNFFLTKLNYNTTNSNLFLLHLITSLPLIASASGNAGTQTSITIIRTLTINKVKKKDYYVILRKEFLTAFLISIFLVYINIIRLLIVWIIKNKSFVNIFTPQNKKALLIISLSLFLAILISKIIGVLMPIFAKLIKFDPAVFATPMLTTCIDIFSIVIVFSIALLF